MRPYESYSASLISREAEQFLPPFSAWKLHLIQPVLCSISCYLSRWAPTALCLYSQRSCRKHTGQFCLYLLSWQRIRSCSQVLKGPPHILKLCNRFELPKPIAILLTAAYVWENRASQFMRWLVEEESFIAIEFPGQGDAVKELNHQPPPDTVKAWFSLCGMIS